jgi:competence protein ComEC
MTPLLLVAGVLAGAFLAHPPDPSVLLLAAAGSTAWRILGGRPIFIAVLGLFLVAGALADRAWQGTADPRQGPVSGIVRLVTDPRPLPGGGWRAEVRLDGRRYDAEFPSSATGVGELLAGEGIQVAGDLDGDPWRWQRIRHVEGTLEVGRIGGVRPAGPLHRLANALRRTLVNGTAPLPPEQASLLTGLVLGDDRAQDDRTSDDFRAAGLGHLLAVSGQNVALVVAAAGPLLRRLRFRTRLPATLLLLGFFALVTRFEPSVLRATVMAGGSALIAARGREADGLRLLCLTVVGLVFVDPLLVHRAAFQLSVAACAGIILGSASLADLLPGPRPFREAAAVTLAAQSAVAPLLLLLFGPVPVAALPANLLAAPVAGPLMVWGLTGGLLAGIVGPPLDGLLHLPSGLGLGWIGGMAAWAGRHPIGLLGGGTALATSALVACAAVCSRRSARRPGHLALLVLGAILLTSAVSAWSSVPGKGAAHGLRILDPEGTVIVVDEFRSAERLLADLRRAGVRAPTLFVFRAVVPPEVVAAFGERFPEASLWGPPGSTTVTPPAGTVLRVGGDAWQIDLLGGHLRVRRRPEP